MDLTGYFRTLFLFVSENIRFKMLINDVSVNVFLSLVLIHFFPA